ncbi:hypothetical protein [Variovorax rhizosphaerae]|uniref:Secreted protein n=1 Tax=Variovorax rhizosphaerae TaxID=1836200 RepID=A0ABU8WRA6_9BURK
MEISGRALRLAAWCAAALGTASVHPPAHAESTMCPQPQRAVFSCPVGAKQVAVCASDPLTEATGTLQYRFGRPAKVEMAYPPKTADWRALTRGGTLMFSGGGGAFIAFEKRPYRYVVYSAVGQGWGSKAGVVVERSGKRVANLSCTAEASSELGPALFSAAGIKPFEDSFELP